MDYLEKLEKSLDVLEQQADKLSGLPDLIKVIGETANDMSEEKKEIKSISEV